MTDISKFNLSTIALQEPKELGDISIINITSSKRTPQFLLKGTLKYFGRNEGQFNTGQMYLIFKPSPGDIAGLLSIENYLSTDHGQEYVKAFGLEDFEHSPTLTNDYDLRLKLKERNGVFAFGTDIGTSDQDFYALAQGTPVSITIKPGFYVNSDKKYGLFWTLQYINLLDQPKRKK